MNRLNTILACIIILTSFSVSVFADSYTYDANGNMLQDSGKSQCYGYNEANQLKNVSNCAGTKIAEYYYDYTGRRIKTVEYNSTGGNITTYYPSSDFETVVGGPNPGNTTYYYVNGERVARRDPNGSMHYISSDHLGSTSVVTDSAGNLEEKTRYLPFGDTLTHSGVSVARYLYTGQEKDTESGLYYYGARYYNPQLMHFTQPDTYTSNIYNPQDLNEYSYVQNNPLKYTDPTGHQGYVDAVITMGFVTAAVTIGVVMLVGGSAVPAASKTTENAVKAAVKTVQVSQTAANVKDFSESSYDAVSEYKETGSISQDTASELALNSFFLILSAGDMGPAEKGLVKSEGKTFSEAGIKFGQKAASAKFAGGKFAGMTIEEVANGLKSGKINPNDLPVDVIIRNGEKISLNTRTLKAFQLADTAPTIVNDVTGNLKYEAQLTMRLAEMGGSAADDIPIRPVKTK